MKWVMIILSKLPFFVLHRISDGLYYLIYYVLRYRRKVVRENLVRSFLEKSLSEIVSIEKKFYSNFCDIIVETIKNFSISKNEMRSRCHLVNPELIQKLFDQNLNLTGISSHLANWECLALSLALEFKHISYGVYKPLSDKKLNDTVVESRERFGIKMIPIKQVRHYLDLPHDRPIVIGLLSDQAPHDYSKAFEVHFLNQKTYVVPGPGILTVERGFTPIWGWMRRVGRTRFEWGIEVIEVDGAKMNWSHLDLEQIDRIANAHSITKVQSAQALAIIKEYSNRLEAQIRKAPEDWLWSHRRWKKR